MTPWEKQIANEAFDNEMNTPANTTADAGQNSAKPRNEIILDPSGNTYLGELANRFVFPNGLRLPAS